MRSAKQFALADTVCLALILKEKRLAAVEAQAKSSLLKQKLLLQEEVGGENSLTLPPGWSMRDTGWRLGGEVKSVLDHPDLQQCQL